MGIQDARSQALQERNSVVSGNPYGFGNDTGFSGTSLEGVLDPKGGLMGGEASGWQNLFGGTGLEGLGQGLSGIGGLMQMYNMWDANQAQKKSLSNQATAYNNNAQNQQNFTNGVIDVFGSGQQRTNNTMAKTNF